MWRFHQCFGEKTVIEDLSQQDILSAVEFDETGKFLATGDRAGRVVIFEVDEHKQRPFKTSSYPNAAKEKEDEPNGKSGGPGGVGEADRDSDQYHGLEYKFQCEFQSHVPEFDYLKSLEIEGKINKIKWCKPSNDSLFLLSTNDKTIKLWKVYEKQVSTVSGMNLTHAATGRTSLEDRRALYREMLPANSIQRLSVPKVSLGERSLTSYPRRIYSNAHAYHVNSISVNSDGETFLSADDLRINLWNLAISSQSYNIVDIKPANMDDLAEVITAAEFHPSQCNIFMYSSSRGSIKLGDMRSSALCDVHSKRFELEVAPATRSFVGEIIASISDIKFADDGRYIVSRDYLTLKVWDINMESRPVQTINIHDYIRPKLDDLFESEVIFDRFEISVSADGNYIATGSYNNTFHIFDRHGNSDVTIEASRMHSNQTHMVPAAQEEPADQGTTVKTIQSNVTNVDYQQKALQMSMHPTQPFVAVACVNNLYLYGK